MKKITLAAARINSGLTQKEAAKQFNISNKTLSRWENGETYPNPLQVNAICALYDCTYDDIIFLKPNPLKAVFQQ